TVKITDRPYEPGDAMTHEPLGQGFHRLVVERGFMQEPHVPRALARAAQRFGLPLPLDAVTYYAGRDTFLATSAGSMGRWSESLFAFLARDSRPATAHFCLPPEQVVEIGSQIDL